MSQPVTVPAGTKIKLADFDSRYKGSTYDKQSAAQRIRENAGITAQLAYQLYAENKRRLLMVLQGMDTAGKDGTIRTVMRGVNPQSCQVVSFKQPSSEELDHDFLWRIHKAIPRRGNIGIFNRSQYEDVLVVRVHNLVPKGVWQTRYDRINEFERLLVEGDLVILKCYLHIDKEDQRKRLQARIDNPHKNWKLSKSDLAERKLWDKYQAAYETALTRCNTAYAPWHIIPAGRKWYRNVVVSDLIRKTLEKMNPQFPKPVDNLEGVVVE